MLKYLGFGFVALLAASAAEAQGAGKPIIDMHMHAWSLTEFGGERVEVCLGKGLELHGTDPAEPFEFKAQLSCPSRIRSPATDAAVLSDTIAAMKRFNIVAGVLAGDRPIVAEWRKAHSGRFIPAANFFIDDGPPPASHAATLERQIRSGETQLFAEVTPQYRGLAPDHPSLEPFYAMAERLDVPVGIHMGYGAPGGPYWVYPKYRASLGKPLLLEDLLTRYPKMRVYVMHAAMPMTDEMIALMFSHPQVFVDISGDNWGMPRAEFYHHLRRMVEAGYGKRIMFGSDQMVWPQTIEVAVASITEADFLTPAQNGDILYNNAARFLRLTPSEIAAHHRR
ncbi:MAG: amidohydrolase family protein [Sphingomonas sp.]|nr:amidohydrolase family protein [Sphingomonas sp.]